MSEYLLAQRDPDIPLTYTEREEFMTRVAELQKEETIAAGGLYSKKDKPRGGNGYEVMRQRCLDRAIDPTGMSIVQMKRQIDEYDAMDAATAPAVRED
jgi:hypothetical protein